LEQPIFDLIHRPFQITSPRDLNLLQRAGTRFIVSQLDCIAFANPQYAANATDWARYRSLTRQTFALADGITFISNDANQDTMHQGLDIPADRKCVTYIGVDHQLHSAVAQAPTASERLTAQPYILMIGTNFKHKNRPWALRAFAALIRKHGWQGLLVFAGPDVSWGGSVVEEKLELERHPELESRTCYLGAVSGSEKQWLLEHAALVLYPSNYEGFGLVPFEAAAAGTPALTMFSTSLSEILGDQVIYLESFDAEQGAETIWQLLSNSELAKQQVNSIKARATLFTWDGTAKRVLAFYKQILQMPPRSREVPEELAEIRGANRFSKTWTTLRAGFRVLWTQGPFVLLSKARRYVRVNQYHANGRNF
jgi:glycosyltransferase involved in cell wall biosynthesis